MANERPRTGRMLFEGSHEPGHSWQFEAVLNLMPTMPVIGRARIKLLAKRVFHLFFPPAPHAHLGEMLFSACCESGHA